MRALTDFVFGDKNNKRYLIIALFGTILQWIIFKILYPFPDFFSDSYSYIFAAQAKLPVSIWPIGYSKFLFAFHQITKSDTALVTFQYFSFEFACLYFFFTILYLFKEGKTRLSRFSTNIIFIFIFFNPLSLYISNYINSDPLFASVSLVWFTTLIWIIQKPKTYQIVTQSSLLFIAFTIRNNAYYYPVLSILAFSLSSQSATKKIVGCLAGIILISVFVFQTREAAYEMTDTRQFSLFTGWQLANNALYMYDKIQIDSTELPTPAARKLNRICKRFFGHMNEKKFNDFLYAHPGNFFIQYSVAPLKNYVAHYYQDSDEYSSIIAWGKASADFTPFGSYLIKTYPFSYTKYFIIPNAKNYFLPDLEKLEYYNLEEDSVKPIAQKWFEYDSMRINSVSKDFQGTFLLPLPSIFLVVNFTFLYLLGRYILKKKKYHSKAAFCKTIILVGVFWILNFAFGIFATILVLRYEFIPLILFFVFSVILWETMEMESSKPLPEVIGSQANG